MGKIFLTAVLILLFSSDAQAFRLGMLMRIAKEQQQMDRILNKETATYNLVKNAVDKEEIDVGQSQASIIEKYGMPVVAIRKKDSLERWVYKLSYASHFDKTKIYLFFDNDKILSKIESFQISED